MSLPPTINRDFFPARWRGSRDGHPIVAIIAHATVGTDSRAYLQRGGDRSDGSDRKVSIHVLIQKDGTIYRMVDDSDVANHAGFGTLTLGSHTYTPNGVNLNTVTLGFELENKDDGIDSYTEPQLLSMGWQVAQWRAKYGNLPIFRHADVDPGRKFDTRALTVAQIEQWVIRAAGQTRTGFYHYHGLKVYQRADLTGTLAGYLPTDSVVEIDAVAGQGYAANAGHLSSGMGFVDLTQLDRV